MNDVRIIHVFSCVDKFIDLQTDQTPNHNIQACDVSLEKLAAMAELIPLLEFSMIAMIKKWVNEERRGASRTRRLFRKFQHFSAFHKISNLVLIGKKSVK